jgi:hypothetical protein
MKGLGALLMFLGIGSIVLSFTNYEFRLLSFIDTWGDTVAWCIRGGLVLVGAALFFRGRGATQSQPA